MKQIKLLILVSLLVGGCLSAQTLTSIQVGTNPNVGPNGGAIFLVDGAAYTSLQTFQWPVGSKHILQFPLSVTTAGGALNYQSAQFDNIRYTFAGWQENTGLLAPSAQSAITITADPGLTSVIAQITILYHVQINFGPATSTACGGAPNDPSQSTLTYGIVYLDGTCYSSTTDLYLAAGPHILNAFPFPGWVFYGWDINGNASQAFLGNYVVAAPANIIPQFSIAKRVQFTTNPMGLNVLIDRTRVITPQAGTSTTGGNCAPDYTRLPPTAPSGFSPLCIGQFDFLPGSKHQVGAETPQMDKLGNYWIFGGFSDGLGQNTTYTADYNTNSPDAVVANFLPGIHSSITTTPAGLKLQIDGTSTISPFNAIWGAGETHTLAAAAQQTDSKGRAWVFSNWSNGGSASQSLTVPPNDITITANYTLLGQAQVTSIPVGLTFTVDGTTCVTPCVVNKGPGAKVQVAIPASTGATTNSRLDFTNWSDGSTAATREITLTQDAMQIWANYQTSYTLILTSNPANGSSFKTSPTSPDGFYPSNTPVTVTAVPNNGFKFIRWDGDLAGAFASGTVTMSGPRSAIASMVSVPYIPSAGIQTAAGPTPDGAVAPGSIIAVYGQSLAPTFQVGPTSPLSQAISDTTVSVNGQFFPLLFVSPTQIAAQVPWELADGGYTMTVRSTGQPDVTGSFTISRDAPAVFTLPASTPDQPLALALHDDGSVITSASPVRRNEQISLYTTGLGPYDHQIPAGFPVPSTDKYTVVDPVSVTIGPAQLTPVSSTAATAMVGMTIVKVKITDAVPAASTVSLTLTVNGKTSTPVWLPLQ